MAHTLRRAALVAAALFLAAVAVAVAALVVWPQGPVAAAASTNATPPEVTASTQEEVAAARAPPAKPVAQPVLTVRTLDTGGVAWPAVRCVQREDAVALRTCAGCDVDPRQRTAWLAARRRNVQAVLPDATVTFHPLPPPVASVPPRVAVNPELEQEWATITNTRAAAHVWAVEQGVARGDTPWIAVVETGVAATGALAAKETRKVWETVAAWGDEWDVIALAPTGSVVAAPATECGSAESLPAHVVRPAKPVWSPSAYLVHPAYAPHLRTAVADALASLATENAARGVPRTAGEVEGAAWTAMRGVWAMLGERDRWLVVAPTLLQGEGS